MRAAKIITHAVGLVALLYALVALGLAIHDPGGPGVVP